MIQLVWAQARNGVIGVENELPWHFKKDLKFFKETTTQDNSVVVMGAKTFDSIGRPNGLPNRENLVLSRVHNYENENVKTIRSIEDVLALDSTKHIFIIGGASIYEQFLPFADKLTVTKIHEDFKGDTYAPEIPSNFSVTECFFDQENGTTLEFVTYEKVDKVDFGN